MDGFRLLGAGVAAALLASTAAAGAQGADDIWNHLINAESTGAWTVSQDRPRPRDVAAPDIPGEQALRVEIRGPGANPWDVQATSPIAGEIKQGDVVLLMYYARAEAGAEGGSVLPTRIQLSGAPYTAALQTSEALTEAWAQHCAYAVAAQDFAAGSANVSLHLATARQTIDLGPVFVFNLGPDFDQAGLSNCSE